MFTTRLRTEAMDEPGLWLLLEPLVWADGATTIEVPEGFVTDLASVPRMFRGILDVTGRSRRAATLHDWLYRTQTLTRAESDAIFRKALIAEGVSIAGRWIYWLGVRVGGHIAWGNKTPDDKGPSLSA